MCLRSVPELETDASRTAVSCIGLGRRSVNEQTEEDERASQRRRENSEKDADILSASLSGAAENTVSLQWRPRRALQREVAVRRASAYGGQIQATIAAHDSTMRSRVVHLPPGTHVVLDGDLVECTYLASQVNQRHTSGPANQHKPCEEDINGCRPRAPYQLKKYVWTNTAPQIHSV